MIMVEIEIPSLKKSYDFRLKDDTKIDEIIDEVCEIICQKEKKDVLLRTRDMMLSSISNGIIMNNMYTLGDYNVHDGAMLMLI